MPSLLNLARRQNQLSQGLIGKSPSTDSTNNNNGCCSRFCGEFSLEFFGEHDSNGRTLDLVATFCTERTMLASLIKLLLWGITVYTYGVGWLRSSPDFDFYLAYLTNWSLTYAVIYMTLSLVNTWCCNALFILKATWIMYSVAAVHEVAVTILFWLVEYDPDTNIMDYYTIMSHGGVAVLVLFEGIIVNRVPVRLKHYIVNFLLAGLYLGWTVIQTLVLEYNPNKDDDDDVAIYSVIQWGNDPIQAGIVAGLVVFIFLPIDQLLIWGISLIGRRYKSEESSRKRGGSTSRKSGDIEQARIWPTKSGGSKGKKSSGRGQF